MTQITMSKLLEDHILPLQEEYDDYVSLARKTEEDRVFPLVDKLFNDHPEMLEKLNSDSGDWQHGFNSGVLAYTRLISGIIQARNAMEIAEAYEDFPSLDT
jgi:hypothetical protein